jgi:5-deoxy-glucuronate isomerase
VTEREVRPEAPPNDVPADRLRISPGADGVSVQVDPGSAGWRYLTFRAVGLGTGDTLDVGGDGIETCVVPVEGGVAVEIGRRTIELPGRAAPFDALPSALYLPPDTRARLVGWPSRDEQLAIVAIASAPASRREGVAAEPIAIRPSEIAVEIRGGGNATRQINHIIAPGFPADRLLVVEVLTPSGNWSSWPPHKHDVDAMPGEAVLEEIYYYRFRRPEAWAVQRLYRRPDTPLARSSGPRDALWAVRGGDVVIVTDGYHPFVASHGDDAYYLNALAGDRRTMACSFDPDLDWVRSLWDELGPDPRLPLVSAV